MDDLPAVRALGSLFKLTEVHLWADGLGEMQESSYHQVFSTLIEGDKLYAKSESNDINGLLPEDTELSEKLNELGLPLSFHTNKEKRNGMNSGKRRGSRRNNRKSYIEIDEHTLDSVNVSEDSMPPTLIDTSEVTDQSEVLKFGIVDVDDLLNLSLDRDGFLSSTACTGTSIPSNEKNCYNEASDLGFDHSSDDTLEHGNNALDEVEGNPCTNGMMTNGLCRDGGSSEGCYLLNESAQCHGKEITEQPNSVHLDGLVAMVDYETEDLSNDISFKAMEDSDAAAHAQFSELANDNTMNSFQTDDSGEWFAYWDDFHERTYFYNVKTEESSWYPPPGMEHLVYDVIEESTNMVDVDGLGELDSSQIKFRKFDEVEVLCDLKPELSLVKDSGPDNGSLSQQMDEASEVLLSIDSDLRTCTTKRKKKSRRAKSRRKTCSSEDYNGILLEDVPSISKYWCQRYILFSKFDHGIQMDEEGWFSVTPEPLARHHASRCCDGSIIDLFTGVGGNAIQFAQRSKHVIAIDIDPKKIEYARHNSSLYGVGDNIDFINGDSFCLAPKLKANTAFMSPPWGGPNYSKVKKFDINTMLKPHDGQILFDTGKKIAQKIVMFLPRNVDINQLAELSLSAIPPWSLEVERNFLNGRLKGITAYFIEPSIL